MTYQYHRPGGVLAEYIDQMWWYDTYEPSTPQERIMPTGTTELIFHLHPTSFTITAATDPTSRVALARAIVAGPYVEHFLIDAQSLGPILGIHFKPGGAYPFLPIPIRELQNAHVCLADLWGDYTEIVSDQLAAARSPSALFAIMEAALLLRFNHAALPHPGVTRAIELLRHRHAPNSITHLADHIGLSQRHLLRVFEASVGLSHKQFTGIIRFQQILHKLQRASTPHWQALLGESEYFDQAHFIHDFRRFTGMTPSTYLRLKTIHRNHVAEER